ncbi:MAG: metallophosphoesterase [Chloroflexi bacterium]|nr:metallophosphoesterase [Chloroflexota bacterium]
MTNGDLIVAHSSDLHIGASSVIDEFHPLCRVIDTAEQANADVLLLAGDVFDHNRLPLSVLDQTARRLGDSSLTVVILPGNHDCITPDSVYRRGGVSAVTNVHVIGLDAESLDFPDLDLQIWGKAHFDYQNLSPLSDPHPRTARWQIAVAHGHYLAGEEDVHRGWLFDDEQLAATAADYVALGHWPSATTVGAGKIRGYYSGSPDLAETINVARFSKGGPVTVTRAPLAGRRNSA